MGTLRLAHGSDDEENLMKPVHRKRRGRTLLVMAALAISVFAGTAPADATLQDNPVGVIANWTWS